jgi:hypothetical protein
VPSRLFDTRACRCKLRAGYALDLTLRPAVTITGLVLNVTATNTTGNGYLTVYPDDGTHGHNPPPTASDLNYSPRDTVPNMTVVQLPNDDAFNIFNAGGSADVVVDLEGYYGQWLSAPPTNIPVFKTAEGSQQPGEVLARPVSERRASVRAVTQPASSIPAQDSATVSGEVLHTRSH